MDETIIKIENAALKLKKFMIKPANLEIPKGYIVGVQGENGAGKTTLLVKSKFVCKFIFQLCGFIYATFIFKRFD